MNILRAFKFYLNINGVIYTSNSAAIMSITNAKNISKITFSTIFKNLLSLRPCLIKPTPNIPPARAVMKYAAISEIHV